MLRTHRALPFSILLAALGVSALLSTTSPALGGGGAGGTGGAGGAGGATVGSTTGPGGAGGAATGTSTGTGTTAATTAAATSTGTGGPVCVDDGLCESLSEDCTCKDCKSLA